jgi:HK97 family phage portal protein
MFEFLKRNKVENLTLKSPQGWGYLGRKVGSGVPVTVETAMRVSAVYACVKIIAETLAATPLHIYRSRPEGGRDRANAHPLSMVFGGVANEENTTQELLEYVLASLLVHGSAYCEIIRVGGRVVALSPLDATCMKPQRDASGKLYFEYKTNGLARVYQTTELWRIAGLSSDAVTGYSNISIAREAIGVSIAAEQHAAKTYSNGASIPGVFEIDKTLTDEGFDRLKKQLDARAGTISDVMKPLLLENGLTYKSISMTLEQAQFIEARKFQIAEVARIFRVPLHKLNEMSNATFSNIEHQSREFVVDTLTPWCVRIEQTIRRDLFTAGEKRSYYAKFNLEGLMRGDTQSRYAAHASALVNGWKTPNEVRQLEDMNSVEGLDEFYKPMNLIGEKQSEAQQTNEPNALEQRQIRAIRSELGRGDFKEWAEGYYSRLESAITGDEFTAEQAGSYCSAQLTKLLAAEDVAAYLKEWESK